MTKVFGDRVEVLSFKGQPVRFSWRGRWRGIRQVIDSWREMGCWWKGEGEKVFFRVEADNGGIYEIYYEPSSKNWRLYRLYD